MSTPTKDQIKHWLKKYGRDRQWLADKLSKAMPTINNWLSTGKAIPDGQLALIRRLMQDDEAAEAARQQQRDPVAQVFSVEVSLPQFRRYNQCALQAQQTLEDWAIAEMDRAAEEHFAQLERQAAPAQKTA